MPHSHHTARRSVIENQHRRLEDPLKVLFESHIISVSSRMKHITKLWEDKMSAGTLTALL